jgi:hypothetical protein
MLSPAPLALVGVPRVGSYIARLAPPFSRGPRRITHADIRPLPNLALRGVGARRGASYSFQAAKLIGPAYVGTNDLTLFCKSLKARVDEREGILDTVEVISPSLKRIPYLNSRHRLLSSTAVNYCFYEVSPRDFGLDLLPKGVLECDFRGLQLSKLSVQGISLAGHICDLRLHMRKSFLEGVVHTLYVYS